MAMGDDIMTRYHDQKLRIFIYFQNKIVKLLIYMLFLISKLFIEGGPSFSWRCKNLYYVCKMVKFGRILDGHKLKLNKIYLLTLNVFVQPAARTRQACTVICCYVTVLRFIMRDYIIYDYDISFWHLF